MKVQAVTPLVEPRGLVLLNSEGGTGMATDPEPTKDLPGLYTVRTRHHHDGDETKNLSFTDAMSLMQNCFEQSNGAVFFASIQRQE